MQGHGVSVHSRLNHRVRAASIVMVLGVVGPGVFLLTVFLVLVVAAAVYIVVRVVRGR